MKKIVSEQLAVELRKAKTATAEQNYESAWLALQRAHFLSQSSAIAHTVIHWTMLKLAWRQRDLKEFVGQIVPALLAAPLTLLLGPMRSLRGGKASGDHLEKMTVPEDIRRLLNE